MSALERGNLGKQGTEVVHSSLAESAHDVRAAKLCHYFGRSATLLLGAPVSKEVLALKRRSRPVGFPRLALYPETVDSQRFLQRVEDDLTAGAGLRSRLVDGTDQRRIACKTENILQ